MKQLALHADSLSKSYSNKKILEHISLQVEAGEFISLIGPSGCGKSTLLRLLLGEEPSDSGSLHVFGKEVSDIPKDVGIVYQKYSLFPHLSIRKNIQLGMSKHKDLDLQDSFEEMIKLFGLTGVLDKYPHQLSGGQQQRASIVQSLIVKPKILFMDEAFGALDPFTKTELKKFMDEYWKKHSTTIIFITHDLNDAVSMGSRVILLSQYYKKEIGQGSKIVLDIPTKLDMTPQEESDLILRIKEEGFDPEFLQELTA